MGVSFEGLLDLIVTGASTAAAPCIGDTHNSLTHSKMKHSTLKVLLQYVGKTDTCRFMSRVECILGNSQGKGHATELRDRVSV